MIDDYKMAQGPAKPATPEEIAKETDPGKTTPNLHRRIDDECTPVADDELAPDQYSLTVGGISSYRTTAHTIHDEESTTTEIP